MFPDPLVFDTYKEFKDYLAAYEIDSCAHYVAYAETKDFKTDLQVSIYLLDLP